MQSHTCNKMLAAKYIGLALCLAHYSSATHLFNRMSCFNSEALEAGHADCKFCVPDEM